MLKNVLVCVLKQNNGSSNMHFRPCLVCETKVIQMRYVIEELAKENKALFTKIIQIHMYSHTFMLEAWSHKI